MRTCEGSAMNNKNFLSVADLSPQEIGLSIDIAIRMKGGETPKPLNGMTVVMLLEKPSLRTRVSFEIGIRQLGGECINLGAAEVGLGVRESVADVARVLDRWVDIIVARVNSHDSLIKFASNADPIDRFGYYKRIGDVCLFVSGVFPGHTHRDYQQLAGGKPAAIPRTWRMRRSVEDYEREGTRFYRLAQEHPTARTLELAGVFGVLRENFASARKPLTYMANRFLHAGKHQVFGSNPG
ncbi:MAG: hypothetical protein IIC24_04750 [Chloroflexi bacterium]|nr:hypothetical protein [Chloroflexota bacterium]